MASYDTDENDDDDGDVDGETRDGKKMKSSERWRSHYFPLHTFSSPFFHFPLNSLTSSYTCYSTHLLPTLLGYIMSITSKTGVIGYVSLGNFLDFLSASFIIFSHSSHK